jgi:TolB-like protein
MLIGRRAFARPTPAQTLAAILSEDPLSSSPSETDIPLPVLQVLRRCLEKSVGERFQSARDLGFALTNLLRAEGGGSGPAARRISRRIVPLTSAAALIVLLALSSDWLMSRAGDTNDTITSIAVLPLTNETGASDIGYLTDGIAEGLISNLSQLPQLRVMARTTVFRYKGQQNDPQKVGRELGVRAVFTARVVQRAQTLRIQAELVAAESGVRLWGETYERTLGEVLTLQEDITQRITEGLRLRLSGTQQQLERAHRPRAHIATERSL